VSHDQSNQSSVSETDEDCNAVPTASHPCDILCSCVLAILESSSDSRGVHSPRRTNSPLALLEDSHDEARPLCSAVCGFWLSGRDMLSSLVPENHLLRLRRLLLFLLLVLLVPVPLRTLLGVGWSGPEKNHMPLVSRALLLLALLGVAVTGKLSCCCPASASSSLLSSSRSSSTDAARRQQPPSGSERSSSSHDPGYVFV
jgi:hypothetical protein